MSIGKVNYFTPLFLGLALCVAVAGHPQKVTTKVSVYSDIFLTDAGLTPLPENAIELEIDFTIRPEAFQEPLVLAFDGNDNLCVSSKSGRAVWKFDAAGTPAAIWDAAGGVIAAAGGGLAVYGAARKRLVFLDGGGRPVRNSKIADFHDFDVDRDGRLIVAPIMKSLKSALIDIISPDGKTFSFGKPLVFPHSLASLNSRSVAKDANGDIYVAFTYFPIVRRYSSEGNLLAEFKIESPAMEAKESYNLKAVGEGIADPSQRAVYKPLIVDVQARDGRIFLLSHIPRLEIVELDGKGNFPATYWMETREIYRANGFAVRNAGGELRFYVSCDDFPDYRVDVLKIKQPGPGGDVGEIESLTREIEAWPEHLIGFNNRGVARHRLGDYRGAIEDFTRAAELAPDFAPAFNNRGLARVKAGDFAEAVADFSRALELDPGEAVVHYNRGIAHAHQGDFAEAIEDFQKAAALDPDFEVRAREQIAYCRARLKTP
jgi:tetratricopeptide (TPR) repeat protein